MADATNAPKDDQMNDAEDDEDDEAPWDEQTDSFVNDIAAIVSPKYKISFRALLADPAQYAGTAGISDTLKNVKTDVASYFDDLMEELQPEQEELTKNMEQIDALYTKLDQAILSKAAIARVPYLKPAGVDFGEADPETITIGEYNNNVDTLLAKFVNISNYIANISTMYKKYNIGSWIFSGERTYAITVEQPESMVITVENAQQYIDSAIDEASGTLLGPAPEPAQPPK